LVADPLKLENHLWALSSLFFALDRTLLLVLWPLLGLEVLKNSFLERTPSRGWRGWIRGSGLLAGLLLVVLVAVTKPCGLELLSWPIAREAGFAFALSAGLGALSARRVPPKLAYSFLLILTALFFVALPHVFRKPTGTPDRSEIRDLADWAKSAIPVDAVFLFPDAGRDKSPGVFRFFASRAVFVDWKSGGQINFSRSFAMEWGKRWENTMERPLSQIGIQELEGKGINYVVTQKPHSIPHLKLVHETQTFYVYRTH